MKQPILILACLSAAVLQAQEADEAVTTQVARPRVVLEQTVVPQKDGGSVTFQKIVPPPPPAPLVKAAVVLTAEEMARLEEIEAKAPAMLNISASVHEGGFTVLRWSCAGKGRLEALSNVDFRLLTGLGQVETKDHYYSLVMAAGADASELTSAQVLQKLALPEDGSPAFVMKDGKTAFTAEEELSVRGMQVLHDYFAANREALVPLHARQEAERAARELAERNAPPPRHAVIQFWPLSAEQKVALRTARSAEPAVETPNTGGAK